MALHLWPRWGLLMMMANSARRRLLGYIVFVWLISIPLETRIAQSAAQPHVCDRVTIDSATDDVGIWHDKIVVFSRSRGLTGPIIWVRIVPPEQPDAEGKIREMTLHWDSHPMAGAACSVGIAMDQKPGAMCSESVPGTQLRLSVTFEPSVRSAERQTEKLTKYVSDEVLCTLSPRPAPERGTKI
jgi:hypothetical protein